ncbi:hypothetical protein [Methylobacterium sp. 77]|uniref:hypothetical protein n=1 Tax=Methylobacterium sp. 77 TaxID=1101192 RepID=UPI00037063D2|nr:hypothetical protein [Methylobacterium sp. 77]
MAQIAAMTEAEVTAIAYLEAANGSVDHALRFAVEDILTLEGRLAEALLAVSYGYVRGALNDSVS